MKAKIFPFLLAVLLAFACTMLAEVIDEIYAIVNDEIITLQDLKTFEQASLRELESRFSGEELAKAKEDLKKNVLSLLINQKVVQSKLKEKNYNVDASVETIIQEIKKQNNISSDEDLKTALQNEGFEFSQWKEQMKEFQKIRQLKYDEIGSKLKIDNPQIMEFYRKNSEQFTIPEEITLNAIYLKKDDKTAPGKEQMEKIQKEVTADNFAAMAKTYSQMPDAATTPLLGKFKKGELAKELESEIQKMKPGAMSPWIETDKGWYLLQLLERQEARLREYKDVRDDIANIIREQIENDKFQEYIEQLKKESYIKILKQYQG